ncbi:MAG: SpoIID/LytB domain-containing protein [Clostridia bacterium]|nr:SpoIID/LytB domain-containing protein [Clostridia bacterium]
MKNIIKILLLINMMLMMCSISFAKSKVKVPETVRIKLNDGEIIEIGLDEYLYGVVSSEMGTSYQTQGKYKQVGIEALKAQAVASRSYAVYSINHSKYDGYDLTATTSDQVYKTGEVKDIVKQAVDTTSSQVMTYDDEVISAYFFSTSGGHTESSEDVWYAKLPYARGVKDPYEPYIDGKSEWEIRISADKYGEIKILERSENGRVTKLKVGGQVYEKSNIRAKLGNTFLKSTWFDLEYDEDTNEYVLIGKGYGHGVGMSQYGAMGMAEAGFNYEEILKWYYTDIEIVPEQVDYIVIDNAEDDQKYENEKDKEYTIENKEEVDDSIQKADKDFSESKPVVVTKERGPLLKRLISTIESWR